MKFDENILLITNIHRSGGTFLSQLFDSHPEIYSHPGELEIWKPKPIWGQVNPFTQIDLNNISGEQCFELIREYQLTHSSKTKKFNKSGKNKFSKEEKFEFTYDDVTHKEIFCEYFNLLEELNRKTIVEIYLQSLFKSWNQIEHYKRKYINFYISNLWCDQISMIRFFQDFPNSKCIFILRRPDYWLKSTLIHRGFKVDDVSASMCLLEYWMDSVRNLYTFQEMYQKNIIPCIYENLLYDTENHMKKICNHIGISYHETLSNPTFLGNLIYPNSSYDLNKKGIVLDEDRPLEFIPEITNLLDSYITEYYETKKVIENIFYS